MLPAEVCSSHRCGATARATRVECLSEGSIKIKSGECSGTEKSQANFWDGIVEARESCRHVGTWGRSTTRQGPHLNLLLAPCVRLSVLGGVLISGSCCSQLVSTGREKAWKPGACVRICRYRQGHLTWGIWKTIAFRDRGLRRWSLEHEPDEADTRHHDHRATAAHSAPTP